MTSSLVMAEAKLTAGADRGGRRRPRAPPRSARSCARRAARWASRTALAIPSGLELPCAITATPRRPSRIAPPAVFGSSSSRSGPTLPRISSPPSDETGAELDRVADRAHDRLGGALHQLQRDVAGEAVGDHHVDRAGGEVVALDVAGEVQRPVAGGARRSWASTTSRRALLGSSPFESRPTRGRSTPCTASMNAAPM